jgi:hypothetical protein
MVRRAMKQTIATASCFSQENMTSRAAVSGAPTASAAHQRHLPVSQIDHCQSPCLRPGQRPRPRLGHVVKYQNSGYSP